MKPLLLGVSAFILLMACNREQKNKYYTGLKVYKEFDRNRLFDTTNSASPYFYRPVKIDLFYPSTENSSAPALTYGEILDMYEERMNFSIPPDSARKTSRMLAAVFSEYLHVSNPDKMLNYKTSIFRDLALPERRLPLIIYASGMNGSSWENPVLFDSLARAGFVVAVISSVGKFPGFMTGAVDLDEQVKDIMYVKRKLKTLPFIDAGRIGLMSWSMGGNATSKSAMLSNDFKCLLSFDGTEIHYYGFDTAWDKEFDAILSKPPHIPERIDIPFMYLSSDRKPKDSVYVLPNYISSREKYFLQLKGSIHESFSSLLPIAYQVEKRDSIPFASHHDVITRLTITFFDQFLNKDKSCSVSSLINELIRESPESYNTSFPSVK